MKPTVLWLDNDIAWTIPYVQALEIEGFDVTVTTTLSECAQHLRTRRYDLLILDIMVPTISEEEEAEFPPNQTDLGHDSGMLFYKLLKEKLLADRTAVLVMTVRSDDTMIKKLKAEGLADSHISTKLSLREIDKFIAKVNEVRRGGNER